MTNGGAVNEEGKRANRMQSRVPASIENPVYIYFEYPVQIEE